MKLFMWLKMFICLEMKFVPSSLEIFVDIITIHITIGTWPSLRYRNLPLNLWIYIRFVDQIYSFVRKMIFSFFLLQEAKPIRVLHLSDTHFDPEYVEGSNADCSEPLCCRATSGAPKNQKSAAGRFGDYG